MVALKARHISKCPRKKYIIWFTALKNWRLPTQVIIFLDFWAEILRIAHPVNYSYLSPCIKSYHIHKSVSKIFQMATLSTQADIVSIMRRAHSQTWDTLVSHILSFSTFKYQVVIDQNCWGPECAICIHFLLNQLGTTFWSSKKKTYTVGERKWKHPENELACELVRCLANWLSHVP